MNDVQCVRCGRTIAPEEMENGLVLETEKGFYCSDCISYVEGVRPDAESRAGPVTGPEESSAAAGLEGAQRAQPLREVGSARRSGGEDIGHGADETQSIEDDPVSLLQHILNEVKPIRRAIMYEKSSVWNVLGGIAQVFALGTVLIILVRWNEQADSLLLLACFLQLLTITFFLKGK